MKTVKINIPNVTMVTVYLFHFPQSPVVSRLDLVDKKIYVKVSLKAEKQEVDQDMLPLIIAYIYD